MMQSPISLSEIFLTLMAAGVQFEELETCLDWAFGDRNISIREWVQTWNSRHKDLYEMKGTDTVFHCVYHIGKAYVKRFYKVEAIPCSDPYNVSLQLLHSEEKNGDNRGAIQAALEQQNGSVPTEEKA